MQKTSPLGALARGLVAGAIGTGVMTGYQLLVGRLRGQQQPASPPETWADAPPPAQVGKRILAGVFREQVALNQANKLTNAMHGPTEPVGAGSTDCCREPFTAIRS